MSSLVNVTLLDASLTEALEYCDAVALCLNKPDGDEISDLSHNSNPYWKQLISSYNLPHSLCPFFTFFQTVESHWVALANLGLVETRLACLCCY